MHKTAFFFLLFYVFIFNVAYAEKTINVKIDGEEIEFETDGRQWAQGLKTQDEKKGMIEYVLPGETPEAWTETITLNYFKGIVDSGALSRFMVFTEKGLRGQCQGVDWNIISKKGKMIVYEWVARKCSGGWADQSEVASVIQGEKSLYVLHYASRKAPVSKENHGAWAALLGAAVLSS